MDIAVNQADTDINIVAQSCLRELMQVWFDFERQLGRVPIVRRLDTGTFSKGDYLTLLRQLRQQVIEGSRWIARGASSFDRDYSDVRSVVIGHAHDEHKDYQMLEDDYCRAGGNREEITDARRNVGTEALHGFLMYRASQPNPFDLLGAMWIIEGLGQKMASSWAGLVDEVLGDESVTQFMKYHGENDEQHMDKLYETLDRVCTSEKIKDDIVRTARVVARLYALQLEEMDNEA